ncbi:MAG: hypothetical protein V4614_17650 [Pseudomonadota bacterium]
MLTVSSRATGQRNRREITIPDGFRYHKSEWLLPPQDSPKSPTIFLVEQPPGSVLRTHFHTQNEFQVFVAGSGWMGKSEVRPLVCHYASAYTGYGPITAGPEGLSYFTIRAVLETGAFFVPDDRDRMVRGPKGQFHVGPLSAAGNAPSRTIELASANQDHVKIFSTRLAAGESMETMAMGASVAQFNFVCAGALSVDGHELNTWECACLTQGDPPAHLLAGPEGVDLLTMLIDKRADVYGG